jgi:hypothetical protein
MDRELESTFENIRKFAANDVAKEDDHYIVVPTLKGPLAAAHRLILATKYVGHT